MTTVQDLRNSIDTTNLIADEDITLDQMIDTRVESKITSLIDENSKTTMVNTGRANSFGKIYVTYYSFDNEEILNTLRQLYVATKNNFVKEVVKTVGQSKKMSEKQLDIITSELVKFNQITLNF